MVEIIGDGCGIAADRFQGRWADGLSGIRAHAEMVGANGVIGDRRPHGTTLRIDLRPRVAASDPAPARILVVDDHVVVREAIAAAFEAEHDITVVAQAGSLATAVQRVDEADVAIVNLPARWTRT